MLLLCGVVWKDDSRLKQIYSQVISLVRYYISPGLHHILRPVNIMNDYRFGWRVECVNIFQIFENGFTSMIGIQKDELGLMCLNGFFEGFLNHAFNDFNFPVSILLDILFCQDSDVA